MPDRPHVFLADEHAQQPERHVRRGLRAPGGNYVSVLYDGLVDHISTEFPQLILVVSAKQMIRRRSAVFYYALSEVRLIQLYDSGIEYALCGCSFWELFANLIKRHLNQKFDGSGIGGITEAEYAALYEKHIRAYKRPVGLMHIYPNLVQRLMRKKLRSGLLPFLGKGINM